MPKTKPYADLSAKIRADPARRARIEEMERAMEDVLRLAELLEQGGLTQRAATDGSGQSQRQVVPIDYDTEGDGYLSTLADGVAALGGELRLTAVFADEAVSLVATPGERTAGAKSA